MKNVKVYSRPTCSECNHVKEYLDSRGVSYEDIDVVDNKKAQDEMKKKYGIHITPIVVIGDQVMVGYNLPKLDRLLSDR